MGRHRDGRRFRGVSIGLIFALAAVALVAAGVFGWLKLGERIHDQGAAAAGVCVEGDLTLHVAADPAIATPLTQIGREFTDSEPVIRDHCVRVEVISLNSDVARDALVSETGWDERLGPRPSVWVPSSTHDVHRVPAPIFESSNPRSIAASPLVLAVPASLTDTAAPGAGWPYEASWPYEISWQGLAELNNLALPLGTSSSTTDTPSSSTTLMAIDAIAAALNGSAGPVSDEQAQSFLVRDVVMTLGLAYQSRGGDPQASAAHALGEVTAGGSTQVMATTEQSLHALLRERPDAPVTSVYPVGPTPIADYPAAVLSDRGADDAVVRASAEFIDFVVQPQHVPLFTAEGFRTPNLAGTANAASIAQALTASDGATLASFADAARNPIPVGNSMIVLDTSADMAAYINTAASALSVRVNGSPGASQLGLVTANSNTNGSHLAVSAGPLSEPLGESVRSAYLTQALQATTASGNPTPYAGIVEGYQRAVDGFIPGRTNSILLVTSAATDASVGLDRNDLVAAIGASSDPIRPISIDVLVLTSSDATPDTDTLTALTRLTGGTLERIDSPTYATLTEALNRMLP